jgi:ankyrin repeat protein
MSGTLEHDTCICFAQFLFIVIIVLIQQISLCNVQVNMPADSFESPLTLAACGGHVELANLLMERGANIEEANDEGYTPLMEAAREGHEEMVALLLAHGEFIE